MPRHVVGIIIIIVVRIKMVVVGITKMWWGASSLWWGSSDHCRHATKPAKVWTSMIVAWLPKCCTVKAGLKTHGESLLCRRGWVRLHKNLLQALAQCNNAGRNLDSKYGEEGLVIGSHEHLPPPKQPLTVAIQQHHASSLFNRNIIQYGPLGTCNAVLGVMVRTRAG